MVDLLLYSFAVLFVVLDPVGTAAAFVTLTPDVTPTPRRTMARRVCLLSILILSCLSSAVNACSPCSACRCQLSASVVALFSSCWQRHGVRP
ncbi:MAG: hypothetical protein FD153_1619 [Rhodospirillaceae bacterium]|nr:MAG: hypothetical protein FD153_1619 [Rhodospirillaceae bacterium]